jgi:hypothetical protein
VTRSDPTPRTPATGRARRKYTALELIAYPTGSYAYWHRLWRQRGIGAVIASLTAFTIPLLVLLADDNTPSGMLYLVLTAACGLLIAALMTWLTCKHAQAREYAKAHPWVSVVPSFVLIPVVTGGWQMGVVARVFGDTSAQTWWAIGSCIGALAALGLFGRAAARSARR